MIIKADSIYSKWPLEGSNEPLIGYGVVYCTYLFTHAVIYLLFYFHKNFRGRWNNSFQCFNKHTCRYNNKKVSFVPNQIVG